MIRTAAALIALSVILLTPTFARKPETGFLDRTISVGGEIYRYQVFLPANWNKHSKWPVILFLHGAGERGDDGLLQTDVGIGHAIRRTVCRNAVRKKPGLNRQCSPRRWPRLTVQ